MLAFATLVIQTLAVKVLGFAWLKRFNYLFDIYIGSTFSLAGGSKCVTLQSTTEYQDSVFKNASFTFVQVRIDFEKLVHVVVVCYAITMSYYYITAQIQNSLSRLLIAYYQIQLSSSCSHHACSQCIIKIQMAKLMKSASVVHLPSRSCAIHSALSFIVSFFFKPPSFLSALPRL